MCRKRLSVHRRRDVQKVNLKLHGQAKKNIRKKSVFFSKKEELNLNANEIKIGEALLNLMKNWDELFAHMGSNKFNKSSILLFLKETTMLNTKEIREGMRIYKKKYYEIKHALTSK